jgi:uncharacterized coiled-coil protein SlyX
MEEMDTSSKFATEELQVWRDLFKDERGNVRSPQAAFADYDQLRQQVRTQDAKTRKAMEDVVRRDNVLTIRLAQKEEELKELQNTAVEFSHSLSASVAQWRNNLLDPGVNYQFTKLKEELKEKDAKLKKLQEDFEAALFTPTSIQGKKLMAKCRLLQEENEEFGMKLNEGRISKLECELALQKEYSEELKKSLTESNGWVNAIEEDMLRLQATVLQLREQNANLQQQLSNHGQRSDLSHSHQGMQHSGSRDSGSHNSSGSASRGN